MVLNPVHFDREGVIAYTLAALFFLAVLAALFFVTRTAFYLDNSWIDLPIFVAVGAGMMALTAVLADQARATGFPPFAMALVQMGILVVFAAIGFVGTVRLFFLWAGGVLGLFAAWMLMLEAALISKIYSLTNFSTFLVFALYVNWDIDRRARRIFEANAELAREREKSETLLYNVLPQPVAARLKAGEAVADAFSDLTVIFIDIVAFSSLAQRLSPGHLVKLLNDFFSAADDCADRHGVEKVKTIGDAYLAVAGGMASRGLGGEAAVCFGRDLLGKVSELAERSGIDLQVRIGIHTGPVVGGVIGSNRLAYDYWGDTMNIASRLQHAAPPGGIAVSDATFFQTRHMQEYESARTALLKGVGETTIHIARF
jgi:class 3 adenylate cyclase